MIMVQQSPRDSRSRSDYLVDRYIEQHPNKPGLENAHLAHFGYSVWTVVDALNAAPHDAGQVAEAFTVPVEAVDAAYRNYQAHQAVIDSLINEHALFHGAVR